MDSAGVEWVCVSTITTLDPFHPSLTFMPVFRNLILHFGYPRSPNLQYIWVYSSIFSPTRFYEMEINAWDFSFFFLLTKDLQKKSQCQIQRLPKLLIHQIILAMRGFWGHEHRTDWPRPEIGQEKCFMCPDQTSTIFCCTLLSIQKDQFATCLQQQLFSGQIIWFTPLPKVLKQILKLPF